MAATATNELTEVISDLVSIESENPPGNEAACAEYIHNWFGNQNIESSLVYEPYEDRPQVVAQIGSDQPKIVLNGHIDVVPAGNLDNWTYPPYEGKQIEGNLYGRGSADMKTGVALAMVAAADLQAEIENGDLSGSLVVQAAIGEETAEPGTKTLLQEGYGGDYGIVLEPTEMRTATSEKGLAWYEFEVKGDPSHASRPDQGTNAILQAKPLLEALDKYDSEIRAREDELVGQAYATVTQFNAGTKENVLPETATVTIDRRFLPSEAPEEIDEEIQELIDQLTSEHNIEISWERTRTYESAAIETDNDLAAVFRSHSSDIAKVDPAPWGVQGSTDVRNFIIDDNTDAITWGPGDLSQAHTFDEHVDVSASKMGLEVLESSLRHIMDPE